MCRPENSLLICDKLHGILVVDVLFSEYYMHRYSIKLFFTPPNSEIICGQNVGTKVVCGIIFFFEKKAMLKI